VSPSRHEVPVEFERARLIILDRAVAGREVVEVSIVESLGYVLAEDIVSTIHMPAFNRAAMDGFAFRHADSQQVDTFEIVATISAGEGREVVLGRGQCVQIMTGAAVPADADAVIPVEQTESLDEDAAEMTGRVRFTSTPTRGANIAFKGEDTRPGNTALESGHLIRSQEVAVLAALGRPSARVYPGPRIAFAATGEELIEPGRELQPGQIYNSNAYSLWSQIVGTKSRPHYLGVIRDDREDLRKKIGEGLQNDFLVL